MIDMFKGWFWKAIKLSMVFLALYVFGDFRINDVNVKDFLQEKIPPAKLFAAKDWLVDMVATAYKKFDHSLKEKTGYDVDDEDSAQEAVKKINEKEQQKMLELLKDNIDVDSQLKAQQAKNQDLKASLQDIATDDL